uniref:Tubby C-terminal domain-containing protein n=1 Tax=Leersia perrieri TaxID=77586 RepID=A0A0D9VTX0_9ORYZ
MVTLRLPSVKLWRAMVRVHSSCSSSPAAAPEEEAGGGAARRQWSEQREVFTIWMKSLVLNGSGCTVYDSGGRIVYRVDNYASRRAADVCLMDLAGNLVLRLLRKSTPLLHLVGIETWHGYRSGSWFTVVSSNAWWWRGGGGGPCCEFRSGDGDGRVVRYRMEGAARATRVVVDGETGAAVAEVKRKRTAEGVALGDDVLTLRVEPNVDRSLVLALLLVHHGLITPS